MTNVTETVLENYNRHDATHAILCLLAKYEQLELDPATKGDTSYLPGAEIWSVIRRVNQLLGNNHPVAQQFARSLQPLFDLRQFQEPIEVEDERATVVVDPRSEGESTRQEQNRSLVG